MEIVGNPNKKINFSPLTKEEEIIQNITMILTTEVGTVPYDRKFGIDASLFLDKPLNIAMARAPAEIIEKVELYEHRVKVDKVTFLQADDGKLMPKVKVRVIE